MLKKILIGLLVLILALIVLIGAVILLNAPANTKAMNEAIDTFIEAIEKEYIVTKLDCGEYSTMKVYGIMKFDVDQYDVEDIGNLSVMRVNIGLMQMATAVLTPVDCDIPLVSLDYMYILGKRTSYLEIYDLVLDKEGTYADFLSSFASVAEKYSDLEDAIPTAAWYDTLRTVSILKSATKADDDELIQIVSDGMDAVISYAKTLPKLTGADRDEKIALQKSYSNGLIENGGISTDAFVSSLGAEETRSFFDSVLFKAE